MTAYENDVLIIPKKYKKDVCFRIKKGRTEALEKNKKF